MGPKGAQITEEAFSGNNKIRKITIDISLMTPILPLISSQNITFPLLLIFPQEYLLSVGLMINCRVAYEPKALLSVTVPDSLHHRHIKQANELKHISFCLHSSFMWIYSLKNVWREGILLAFVITSQSLIVQQFILEFFFFSIRFERKKYENERAMHLILIISSLGALLKVSVLSP